MSTLPVLAMCLLALVAAAAILLPLLRGPRLEAARRDHDLAVYRDQLGELERDLAAGRIAPAQANAARAEIERRILRAADRASGAVAPPTGQQPLPRIVTWGMAIAVPVAATVLYLGLGSPGMPDVPYASRMTAEPEQTVDREEFRRLTERLAERLKAGEGDLRGWVMLARSYRALGRQQESVDAFRNAVEMAGGLDAAAPGLLEDFGEALFMLTEGQVTPEARAAFEAALRRHPNLFKARHYLAVAHLQSGEPARALAIWRGIEADSPAGAPWLAELRRRIENVAAELGVAAKAVEPERPGGVAAAPGPTRADMEAAAQMSPDERAAFIRGMVERLASRLEASPDDPEGWARLSRAYAVLGEAEKAEEARRNAVAQLRERLNALPAESPQRGPIEARLKALENGG